MECWAPYSGENEFGGLVTMWGTNDHGASSTILHYHGVLGTICQCKWVWCISHHTLGKMAMVGGSLYVGDK